VSTIDDELIAVVAHGLLNSVAAIRINADLLRRTTDLGPDQRQMLEAIEVQIRHVGAVLIDLTRSAGPELVSRLDALQRTRPDQDLSSD
jgi:signal transduction histidine kinase